MKKQIKIFFVLLTLALSIFNLTNLKIFPAANATYVEGPITQDTIWTRVDSPFVVSKNVTVYANATLTIEPGVEVRFGGAFYIIILGRLYVNGTEKTITFTSNKEQPTAGDWGAIQFSGANRSTLIGCSIAYATDGIYIENGNVEVKDSNISLCYENGVNVINSNVTVQNSLIAENQGNGVCITGNGQVVIKENTIMANENGILLTGDEASNVNLTENRISANNHGICIDANNHSNIEILNNIISSNTIGLYISSLTSTYIKNNSISHNSIGILYDQGNHTAQYNDIYGNEMGMDVASDATVDAEYNYWGDPSGPYHESLNPNGKGNPVGGDGVNLDFIYFLSRSIGFLNAAPTANLVTDKVWARPNETIMFFATNSYDADGRVDRYFLDFGDGSNSGWTTLSIFTHAYLLPLNYSASLRVMDDNGTVSNAMTATIYVNETLSSLYVSLELSNSMVQEGEQVSIVVHVTDGIAAVENATVTMLSVKGGTFTEPFGRTGAGGYFVTTFTAPDVAEKANVRIVAMASKNGYADGSAYKYVEVLPFLSVQITANPDVVKSEESASITIYVRSNEQTVANASVTILSTNGSLSSETGITDSNGMFSLVFTAPQTTTPLNAIIMATAKKSGYMDGAGQSTITVEPKILAVQITTESVVTISEAKLNVTVHVEYEIPLAEANVTIKAENGNFSTITGLTDSNGNITFVYTAPAVNEQSSINITATATKDGYAENQSQLQITVNPRTFNIEITAPTVNSEETAIVIVRVTCREDETPVADATVIISASDGSFSDTTEVTDSNGSCTFTFNAPKTTTQLSIDITANVTKNGYTNGTNQTTIAVNPKTATEGGWPILIILLIIIPIAIIVIVVVLIKLRIINVSFKEEE